MVKKYYLILIVLLILSGGLVFGNPIPVPTLLMPEEWIDVMITDQDPDSSETLVVPRAIVDGRYPMENVEHTAVRILDPVAPESENIRVTLDGNSLKWDWSTETYATILPEWPEIPQILWEINPVPDKFELGVHYEHFTIIRPNEYVFFYPMGCWEGQPIYSEKMVAHYNIKMTKKYLPKGVFLDRTPVPFTLDLLYQQAQETEMWVVGGTYESPQFQAFDKDYIMTFINRWEDPQSWFSKPPDMADGRNIVSSDIVNCLPPADDFIAPMSTDGGGSFIVSNIRFWGTYFGWFTDHPDAQYLEITRPRPRYFRILIYDSNPDSAENPGPGNLIYSEQVIEFSQEYFGMIVRDTGVSDPDNPDEPVYTYDHQFEYNLKLNRTFVPEPGARYWISIVSGPIDNAGTLWGWTTSPIPDSFPASGPVDSCSDEVLPETPYQMAFVLSGREIAAAPETTRYKLVEGSTLVVDWIYPGTGIPGEPAPPTIITPITGDFFLTTVIQPTDDLTRHFSVSGLDFRTKHFPEQYWGHRGTGKYILDDQQAIPPVQQMDLSVFIDRGGPYTFESGLVEVPRDISFPWIDIELKETITPDPGDTESYHRVFHLHLVAVPWPMVSFSTEVDHTSGTFEGKKFTDGDLLGSHGALLASESELISNFTLYPTIVPQTPGLDGVIGPQYGPLASAAGDLAKKIWFTTEDDILAEENPGEGDLLSFSGRVLLENAQLIRPFSPMPPVPPVGLDGLSIIMMPHISYPYDLDIPEQVTGPEPVARLLFSIEESFFSEQLGVMIDHGDILCSDGTVYMTNKNLLANFQPINIAEDGLGLDAFHVWPNGEVWFSVDAGFEDQRLGQVMEGDLLSNNGRIILRNRDLLGAFQPLEKLMDFGLDGLWVDERGYNYVESGTLVQGVECILFQAANGQRFILDNQGGFSVDDKVWVAGTLNPVCVSFCMEGHGCIRKNLIFLIKKKPLLGDVNGDGQVDIIDALMTAQYYVGLPVDPFDESVADFNGDGSIDIIDALNIAQHYVGIR